MAKHSNIVGGSSAKRIIHCPGSKNLCDQVPKKSSAFADEGSMLHEVVAQNMLGETVEYGFEFLGHKFTEELDDEMIVPALQQLDVIEKRFGLMDEFEVENEVRFEQNHEVFGSIDVIGHNDKYTFIVDWKFGRGVPVNAENNYQLMFYAAAAAQTPGFENYFAKGRSIVMVIIQPGTSDEPTFMVGQLGDLADFEVKLFDAVELLELEDPPMEEGDWCLWCAAKSVCPIKIDGAIAAEVIVEDIIMDANLPELIEIADNVGPWCKAVYAMAQLVLENGGEVPGKKLKAKRANRKWIDEDEAAKKLKGRRLKIDQTHKPRILKSPAQIETLLKKEKIPMGFFYELYDKKSSGHTMTDADDPSPEVVIGGGAAELAALMAPVKQIEHKGEDE